MSDGPLVSPKPGLSSLMLRVVSAAVLLPLVILATWLGEWPFAILAFIAGMLMLHEWLRMPGPYARSVLIASGLGIAGSLLLVMLKHHNFAMGFLLLGAVGVGLYMRHRFLWHTVGLIYVGLPCLMLLWLRENSDQGQHLVFWLLCVVWATDTGAYFAGRAIGGPKLIPSISPNKTWAGLIGGMICAALVGWLVARIDPEWPAVFMAALSAAAAVVSQAGDFFESGVKRHFGVKDTGALIPGHGGALDRLDGLLFTVPFITLIYIFWGHQLWL
jgi:phosphatidate cytidylyltransferase